MKQRIGSILAALALCLCCMASGKVYAGNNVTCDSSIGSATPVLLVHGFNSNPDMWDTGGDSSIKTQISDLSGVKVVQPFDYSANHFDWVTNPTIGPKLAQTIDCLAQTSQREGGSGKVIVVAHSMGGLATRFAASQTVDGHKVSDELGLVITMGTPNTGAPIAGVGDLGLRWLLSQMGISDNDASKLLASQAVGGMAPGSAQLRALPRFPANVPVRAIAGDVTITSQFLFGSSTTNTDSDLVVPVSSATDEYTDHGGGDGRFVFGCDLRHYDSYGADPTVPIPWPKYQGSQCWHNGLYTTGYIQESVLNGIKDYLGAHTPAFTLQADGSTLLPDSVQLFKNGFSIHASSKWIGAMSEADLIINYVDNSTCSGDSASCPHVTFLNLTSNQANSVYGPDPLHYWAANIPTNICPRAAAVEGPVSAKVGGQDAQLYRQRCLADTPAAPRYAWVVPGKLFVSMTDFGGDASSAQAVQAALQTATWK